MRRRLGVLGLALASVTVCAQPNDARSLFREGLSHAAEERWAAAEVAFAAALEQQWTGQIAYNLAHSRAELGRVASALELAEDILSKDNVAQEVRRATMALAERVRARVGVLTVVSPVQYEDLELSLDGQPLQLDSPTRIDPGAHRITARRSGHLVARIERTVREGEDALVELGTLEPTPHNTEPEPRVVRVVVPNVDDPPKRRRAGWVVALITAVVVAGAVGLGVGLSRREELPRGSLGRVDRR